MRKFNATKTEFVTIEVITVYNSAYAQVRVKPNAHTSNVKALPPNSFTSDMQGKEINVCHIYGRKWNEKNQEFDTFDSVLWDDSHDIDTLTDGTEIPIVKKKK